MTNTGVWKGDDVTAQVLISNGNELALTICDPDEPKLFTIVLHKESTDDELKNLAHKTKGFLEFKKLKTYDTAELDTNCTAELGAEPEAAESTGVGSKMTTASVLTLFLTGLLLL